MTCDNCHQRPAKYHVTRVVNGERSEEDLCEECALQKGELAMHLQPATAIHELLAGLLEGAAPSLRRPQEAQPMQQCPVCGLTRAEFARTGLLGCEACYTAFAETLRPLVRRVQGAGRHHGKVPAHTAERAAEAQPAVQPASAPKSQPTPGPQAPAGGDTAQMKVGSLREQMQAAIAAEDFERAAALRDRIRELEGRPGDGDA
jgi:protein arginine kinase activator